MNAPALLELQSKPEPGDNEGRSNPKNKEVGHQPSRYALVVLSHGATLPNDGAGGCERAHTHILVYRWSALRTALYSRSSHQAVRVPGAAGGHASAAIGIVESPPVSVGSIGKLFLHVARSHRTSGSARGGEKANSREISKVPFGGSRPCAAEPCSISLYWGRPASALPLPV